MSSESRFTSKLIDISPIITFFCGFKGKFVYIRVNTHRDNVYFLIHYFSLANTEYSRSQLEEYLVAQFILLAKGNWKHSSVERLSNNSRGLGEDLVRGYYLVETTNQNSQTTIDHT